jgi:DNA-binding protein HU-beta
MNQEELAEIVATEHGVSKAKARAIIRTFLNTIRNTVARGDKVTLVGFGLFQASVSKPRLGRNPRTGEVVEISEKCRPRFIASRTFKAAVSGETALDEGTED